MKVFNTPWKHWIINAVNFHTGMSQYFWCQQCPWHINSIEDVLLWLWHTTDTLVSGIVKFLERVHLWLMSLSD